MESSKPRQPGDRLKAAVKVFLGVLIAALVVLVAIVAWFWLATGLGFRVEHQLSSGQDSDSKP